MQKGAVQRIQGAFPFDAAVEIPFQRNSLPRLLLKEDHD